MTRVVYVKVDNNTVALGAPPMTLTTAGTPRTAKFEGVELVLVARLEGMLSSLRSGTART